MIEIPFNKAIDICAKIISIQRNDFSKLTNEATIRELIRSCGPTEAKKISAELMRYHHEKYFKDDYDFSVSEYQTFYKLILAVKKAIDAKGNSSSKIRAFISSKRYERFKEYVTEWDFSQPIPTRAIKTNLGQKTGLPESTELKVESVFSIIILDKPVQTHETLKWMSMSHPGLEATGILALYDNNIGEFLLFSVLYGIFYFSGPYERLSKNKNCIRVILKEKKKDASNLPTIEILIYLNTCEFGYYSGQVLDWINPFWYLYAVKDEHKEMDLKKIQPIFDPAYGYNSMRAIGHPNQRFVYY